MEKNVVIFSSLALGCG